MEEAYTGAVPEELQPVGRSRVRVVHGGFLPWEKSQIGVREECEESPP